ncbi:hypothetical protein MMC25_008145 [Agyrium rufum]|nr:hypothetical protein [Agyrium rufum]
MRTSFIAILALASSFTGVFSAPVAEIPQDAALVKREDPLTVLTDLYATVQGYTAKINATTATITPLSTPAEKAAASAAIKPLFTAITAAVTSSSGKVTAVKMLLAKRQGANAIAAALVVLLEDLSGTLNQVIATLGLTTALAFAEPLVLALSALVATLIPVVDGLLLIVEQLLNGLLGGLSIALAGLVL